MLQALHFGESGPSILQTLDFGRSGPSIKHCCTLGDLDHLSVKCMSGFVCNRFHLRFVFVCCVVCLQEFVGVCCRRSDLR
jgi:hypothetical protein